MSFKDKVVIVTGGSSGIGAATAVIFAREGADIVITGRNEANLDKVAEKCSRVGKRALTINADINNDSEAALVIETTIKKFGKIDVLVNNAAIWKKISILDKDAIAEFDKIIKTNLRAVVVLTNLASPHLIKTKGNIVNISSGSGIKTRLGLSAYCTSKAGLNQFSKVIANELAPHGIRVNIVTPGPVETTILETAGADVTWDDLRLTTALNKLPTADDVGELIAYVASDKVPSVTGSNFVIDSGALIKS